VARVTAFAITHAGRGSDEVVSLLCSNILRPFAFTSANPTYHHKKDAKPTDEPTAEEDEDEKEDRSSAQLIALYLISDILSSSSTSGVRHAWRYRANFESAIESHHIFASLGRLERKLKWGRLRGEKWKRSVNNLLNLWEGWCVFSSEAMERFKRDFEKPPLSEAEEKEEEEERRRESERERVRWKAVDNDATATVGKGRDVISSAAAAAALAPPVQDEDEDLDGVPMDDEDLDGVPMDDEDLDGIPMDDADLDGDPMDEDDTSPAPDHQHPSQEAGGKAENEVTESNREEPAAATNPTETRAEAAVNKRRRPIAADMFADSDEE
jgi:U2-associated protein SR140